MDLLQRYRLRQLTHAVYDTAAHEQEATPARARRLVDYPAALGAIVVCLLLLVIMVVKSAVWGVEYTPTTAPPTHAADADDVAQLSDGTQVDGALQSGGGPPPGYRRQHRHGQEPQSIKEITVHIEGAIAQPGIVTLPEGARTHEAVQSAGGATPEAALREINLARKLTDGEYIYVPFLGQDVQSMPAPAKAPSAVGGAGTGSSSSGMLGGVGQGCIAINTATLAELETLNGVGPALAQRLLDARERSGPFTGIDDVDAVSGIGPALLARIEPQICF